MHVVVCGAMQYHSKTANRVHVVAGAQSHSKQEGRVRVSPLVHQNATWHLVFVKVVLTGLTRQGSGLRRLAFSGETPTRRPQSGAGATETTYQRIHGLAPCSFTQCGRSRLAAGHGVSGTTPSAAGTRLFVVWVHSVTRATPKRPLWVRWGRTILGAVSS